MTFYFETIVLWDILSQMQSFGALHYNIEE